MLSVKVGGGEVERLEFMNALQKEHGKGGELALPTTQGVLERSTLARSFSSHSFCAPS